MADAILTQEELKERVNYNPDSGIFTWKSKSDPRSSIKIGAEINCKDKDGYLRVFISYKYYKLHRLAWFYVYGVWPKYQIDHINGDKKDNRISNLRDISQSANMQNIHKANINKLSGLPRGIYFEFGKYRARIKIKNKIKNLGSFVLLSEAVDAYVNAKQFELSRL